MLQMPFGMGVTRYIERTDGSLRVERVYGDLAMKVLYGTKAGQLATGRWVVHPAISRMVGFWQDTPMSTRRLAEFVRHYGIDMTESVKQVPQFKTFNDFFTRRLRPEARPIDFEPDVLISPADGRTLVVPELTGDLELEVKSVRYSIRRLLAGVIDPTEFDGGSAIVIRLCPVDYHRFHFPDSGNAAAAVDVPGKLHSVSPLALATRLDIFGENKRAVTRFDSDGFGTVAIVEVGALCVGTIVQTYRAGRVDRGAEKGMFKFGGSTIVMLFGPKRVRFDEDLVANSARGYETRVLFGTCIARRP
ncbi:MAG: phosphatidylserine decarboxylase [Micrococcales bacterium]|nr:phosphatidylserine decarboxylase [Micrococcales bacterium]